MRRSAISILVAGGLSLGLSVAASAADMALKAPPPPPPLFDWSGWYGGVNGGYSWGRSRATTTTSTSLFGAQYSETVGHQGGEASVEGGYCWQNRSTFVACFEARYDFPRERSGSSNVGIPLTTITNTTHVDPLLIGPHIGLLTDSNHMMWYLAGGLAAGEVGGNSVATGVGGTSTANAGSKWEAGYFLGAGIERMIDQHWSWKVEYDYVRLASNTGSCAPYYGTNYATFTGLGAPMSCLGGNAYDNVLTFGINYHFNSH
jgi:outer membrane immunogenic protein